MTRSCRWESGYNGSDRVLWRERMLQGAHTAEIPLVRRVIGSNMVVRKEMSTSNDHLMQK
jgi:hypothetical protein